MFSPTKTYECKYCGADGFSHQGIAVHSRNCEMAKAARGARQADAKARPSRKARVVKAEAPIEAPRLCYCPQCGLDLRLLAQALAAAKEVSDAR